MTDLLLFEKEINFFSTLLCLLLSFHLTNKILRPGTLVWRWDAMRGGVGLTFFR